jgi:hypothetical protein
MNSTEYAPWVFLSITPFKAFGTLAAASAISLRMLVMASELLSLAGVA